MSRERPVSPIIYIAIAAAVGGVVYQVGWRLPGIYQSDVTRAVKMLESGTSLSACSRAFSFRAQEICQDAALRYMGVKLGQAPATIKQYPELGAAVAGLQNNQIKDFNSLINVCDGGLGVLTPPVTAPTAPAVPPIGEPAR